MCPHSSCNIDSVTIFSEFELLFFQLLKLSPVSQQNLSYLKTCLADLANGLINTMVNSNRFLWQKNHFEVAKCVTYPQPRYIYMRKQNQQ